MDDYSDRAATFGDRLSLAREKQGMTQQQLAKRLGLKVATVRNWETDRSEPRANKVQMMAGFLNVSIVWLMTGEGEGGPAEAGDAASAKPDMAWLLDEMRDIRVLQAHLAERMGRVEKRLREIGEGN